MICLMSLVICNCTVGLKTQNTIVYSSMSKPLTYKGLIRISTNKKIKVSVGDKVSRLDIGGYYVLHKSDLQKLLDIAKVGR